MANWYGTSRTNYFRVKDEEAFRDMARRCGIEVIEGQDGGLGLLETCGEGWPSYCWYHDDESDEEVYVEDFDILAETAKHLAEGEVAVFQEVGAEKARYVTGWAAAVNHLGQKVSVTLDDIYARVEEAGWPRPTPVAY